MPDLRINEYNLISGATADVTGSDLINLGYGGVLVFVNINTITGSSGTAESVTVTVEGKSPVGTNEYYTIIASSALVVTGLVVLEIYPGIAETANLSTNTVLPARWRISADVTTDGDQVYDYDLGYSYIP